MERLKLDSDFLKTKESNFYYEIISEMSIPVCCFNSNGLITFKNQSFTDISPNSNFFDSISEPDQSQVRTNLEKLTVDAPFSIFEHSFIGPDGQVSWYICKNQAVFNQNQELIEYRYIGHDFDFCHRQTEELKQISLRDELTGLYNRHFVIEELKRLDSEINLKSDQSASRRKQQFKPYSIIFCDLNDLKKVNDLSEDKHSAGDDLLRKTAKIIRQNCRDYDLVSRWGGDEFLILLPGANLKKTIVVKDRIFKSCCENSISLAMGFAQKGLDDNYSQVIDKADNQMYLDKEKMKCATLGSI